MKPEEVINQVNDIKDELSRLRLKIDKLEAAAAVNIGVSDIEKKPSEQKKEPEQNVTPAISPRKDYELSIGRDILNVVGVIAILLAVAFFLKFAFDNRWIGESSQVIIGILVGMIMVVSGEYFKPRFRDYALVLTGGGFSSLYLSIFAAYNYYHLIGRAPAFAVMAAITIAAASIAVINSSVAVGLFAVIGGFITPILLPTARGAESWISLFIYIGLLNLGILGISYFKKWRWMEIPSFVFTEMYIASAITSIYLNQNITMLANTVFFIIFLLISSVYIFVREQKINEKDLFLLIGNPTSYLGFSIEILAYNAHQSITAGLLAVVLALLYISLAYITKLIRPDNKYLRFIFLGLSSAAAATAIPLIVDYNWTLIGWAIEAGALTATGIYLKNINTRNIGLVAWMSVVIIIIAPNFLGGWSDSLDRILPAAIVTVGIGLILFLIFRQKIALIDDAAFASGLIMVISNILLLRILSSFIGMVFIDNQSAYILPISATLNSRQLSLSILWSCYGAIVLIIGFVTSYRVARLYGMSLLGVTAIKVFLFDLSYLAPAYRILSLLVLGSILLSVSYIYQRKSITLHH